MRLGSILLYYMSTMVGLSTIQAVFFTDSRQNDYPRLGKRLEPLPKYVYKKWLRLSDTQDFYAYDPGSIEAEYIGSDKYALNKKPDIIDFSTGLEGTDDSQLPTEEIEKRHSFTRKLWFYLSHEPEDFF